MSFVSYLSPGIRNMLTPAVIDVPYYKGASLKGDRSLTPSRVRYNQPQTTPGKPQQSAPAHAPPRPVVVNCHPDSMRVVVQADMFDTGLQVDARHLRLGSGSVSEGSECGAVSSGEAEFTIQAFLQDCGTKLSVSVYFYFYVNLSESLCGDFRIKSMSLCLHSFFSFSRQKRR